MITEEKYELITRNLEEIIGGEELKKTLETRDLNIYWGTATTGKPHIAYILPLLKIKDFVSAGSKVTILLADLHAFLDNLKAPIELINDRTEYYRLIITTILKEMKVEDYKIVKGSEFQKNEDYVLDLYKLSTLTTERDAKKAGCEVVKQVTTPLLSSMIYPLMQTLDEEYLNCDAQFGGLDQRKIFTFAQKYLPLIGYKKRIHLMNPMIEGLNKQKMSSSDQFSKIELTENKEEIKRKIKKSFCEERNVESGIFQILRLIVFPWFSIKGKLFEVIDFNNTVHSFKNFKELEEGFKEGKVHPGDLKAAMVEAVEFVVKPIREVLEKNDDLVKRAYGK